MKIGITTFGGDGGKSGISQYIINLLRQFAALENEDLFEVLVYENEKDLFVENRHGMEALCFGKGISNPVLNVAWHQVGLQRWCRKRDYDVLFLPAGNRRLPLSCPCPTVGTVHDFSTIHVKGKYDPARTFYITRVLPLLIRRLTRVITVSESSKKDILEYAGVPTERITVTPLAADKTLYFPREKHFSAERVARKYGIRTPYILYISRIEHPGKNHLSLVRAFESIKADGKLPHRLVLAGSDWMQAEHVHKEAESAACAADIVFTGFVNTADLPYLYCGADIFVFPSLYEGFGLPVLEAMSCGVPVACSDISSIPEVAGEAALLFNPYSEESIAEGLKTLLGDSQLRERYGKLGLERSKKFSWKKTARTTLDILREAAEDV